MMLCKVIGTLVATQKDEALRPAKLLIVKPINLDGSFSTARDMIAIDTQDAGEGDLVLIAQEGAVVEQVLGSEKVPANTIVMAVVDGFDVAKPD
jgi:microcompartment protein CcmK/EutM